MSDSFASQAKDNAAGGSPTLTSLTDQIEPVEADIELMKRVLATAGARPDLIPTPLLAYLADYLGGGGNLSINTNQIAGFARTQAQLSAIVGGGAFENTSSTTYTDLPTVGPELDGLPSGFYLVLVSAGILSTLDFSGNTGRACMGPSINGSTPVDTAAAYTESDHIVKAVGISSAKLTQGSNIIKAEYKIITGSTAQGQFTDRQIIALRYANL